MEAHRRHWAGPLGTCTLPVRRGLSIVFTKTGDAGDPSLTATTSIEVGPDGAGFLEDWLLALQHRERADDPALATITEKMFGDLKPI